MRATAPSTAVAAGTAMEKTFPRTFEALEGIFQFAGEFFAVEQIDPSYRYAVDFALEEIFTNLVKYHPGNPNDILISLDRTPGRLLITLTDFDVEPFDVSIARETPIDTSLEERRVGGLGIQLTRRLMDDIDYEYADRRSRITLTKLLR
jgi:serine/threonine-protein kinase RsbW